MPATSREARDLVERLALQGKSVSRIRRELAKRGMASFIEPFVIEEIVTGFSASRYAATKLSCMTLPRIVGVIALLAAVGFFFVFGFSLGVILLAIFGGVLVADPMSAYEKW